jgi:GNAT superfamily N-acetyltransferase
MEIREESMFSLAEHASIPIAFRVDRILDVALVGQRPVLMERALADTYIKDYDAVEEPLRWVRFNTSNWGLIAAYMGPDRVGGAIVAFDTPGVELLEERRDLALLWDLRVSPDYRRAGIGAGLFHAVEAWARARGCGELKIETQNINVPACRFYERQGCVLRAANRFVYPDLPDEVQLLWFKSLGATQP